MMRNTRGVAAIDMLSAILVVAAVALYFWPVRVSVPPSAPASIVVAAPNGPSTAPTGDEVSRIVSANILSASRRAPVSRYISPERGDATEFALPSAFQPSPDTSVASAENDADAVPALYGIVNSEGTSRALVRLRESDVNPVLLREGDTRGAYRVVSIRTNAVIVSGPSGQRTLRLSKPVRTDSTGKPQ